jgi:hypothetical protein
MKFDSSMISVLLAAVSSAFSAFWCPENGLELTEADRNRLCCYRVKDAVNTSVFKGKQSF